jgi:predicted acetyltransferase
MKLVSPCIDFKNSYFSYIEELGNEERYPYPMDLEHANFEALVERLEGYSKGMELPDWLVPNTTFWLVNEGEICGCSHLRHHLNQELEFAGGHIGLGIRPCYRGKGLSKLLLNLTIKKAIDMGIKDVHIHCHQSNMQSRRMIESSGAILLSTIELEESNQTLLRYVYGRA